MKTVSELNRDTLMSLVDDLSAYYESLDYIESNIEAMKAEVKINVDDSRLACLQDLYRQRDECKLAIEDFSNKVACKADSCAYVIRRIETEAQLCMEEEQRLYARRKRYLEAVKNLKAYVASTMLQKNVKQLKTSTNTISVRPNGGAQSLTVFEEAAVENRFCFYEGRLSFLAYRMYYDAISDPAVLSELNAFRRVPDTALLRRELGIICEKCDGMGAVDGTADVPTEIQCSECGGTGHIRVAGAKLEPRGHHIRLT